MTTKVTRYLKEHGVSTPNDLPRQPTINDRAEGATTFNFNSRTRGAGQLLPKRTSSVVYLHGEHGRREVAAVWCEENGLLEQSGGDLTAILNVVSKSAGKAWTPAFREVLSTHGYVGRSTEQEGIEQSTGHYDALNEAADSEER